MHSFLVVAALLVSSGFVFSQESDDYAVLQTRADASQNVRVTQKTSSARATNLRLAKEKPPDWEMYVRIFNKSYTDDEKHQKETIYAKRVSEITQWNKEFVEGKRTHVLGVNAFTDGVPPGTSRGGGVTKVSRRARALNVITLNTTTLPASIDWREQKAVTPVKNQAQCGSCWAFSATGAIEGAYALMTGSLKSFPEQQLIDCTLEGKQTGCNGIIDEQKFFKALRYLRVTTLTLESNYPYTSGSGRTSACNSNNQWSGTKVSWWNKVLENSDQLKAALAIGPVSVFIEADQFVFQAYTTGVISSGCGSNVDHGVLAVGYGKLDGEQYFLVKNSWGYKWGDQGYGRIGPNQCGILLQASYPTI